MTKKEAIELVSQNGAELKNLSQKYRVVSYDQRGMGESDKPNSTYDFDLLANDLSELIQKFSLSDVYLVGWSMGCTTSLSYLTHVAKTSSENGLKLKLHYKLKLATK